MFYWGSGLSILGSILAFLAGIMTFSLPSPKMTDASSSVPSTSTQHPERLVPESKVTKPRSMPPGTETTTQTILPDGRCKYTTTKWLKGGKTEVTEVITDQ
jgi:hypothetical protein